MYQSLREVDKVGNTPRCLHNILILFIYLLRVKCLLKRIFELFLDLLIVLLQIVLCDLSQLVLNE
jgi:hypothetical protein